MSIPFSTPLPFDTGGVPSRHPVDRVKDDASSRPGFGGKAWVAEDTRA
jgi:hypothetical protein